MSKVRIYELAKDLGISSKEMIEFLSALGADVRNHMSSIDEGAARLVREYFRVPGQDKPAEAAADKTPGGVKPSPQKPAAGRGAASRPVSARGGAAEARQTGQQAGQKPGAVHPGQRTQTAGAAQPKTVQSQPGTPQAGARTGTGAGTARPAAVRPAGVQTGTARPESAGAGKRTEGEGGASQAQRRPQGAAGRPAFSGQKHGPAEADRLGGDRRPARRGDQLGEERDQRGDQRSKQLRDVYRTDERRLETRRIKGSGQRSSRYKEDEFDEDIRHIETRRSTKKRSRAAAQARKPSVRGTEPKKKRETLEVPEKIVVKELAHRLGVQASELIKRLMKLGVMVSINQTVDFETAALVASDFGFDLVLPKTAEDLLVVDKVEESEEDQVERAPVVTIMGHVDHGKTTLLDAIRETKVAASEAGGITQHIGAYQVECKGKKITFLDTPGHEAFTAMRSRGASVTDVAVLVVAADDGVMPQTVEAINHAKAAKVPVIVAVNKMDRPNANPERIKQQLSEYGLTSEDWGGDTIMVPVSALRKEGIDDLLEMILLVAEMAELKANPNKQARGTVVEARLDKGRGPVATVLIQDGTLRIGDSIIVGSVFGKVRAMINDKGEQLSEAGPSTPVEVLGLSDVPQAGDVMIAVSDERVARQVADERRETLRQKGLAGSSRLSLDELFTRIKQGDIKELNLIIKADVQGSVEALRSSLEKLSNDEVKVNVVHSGVGAISESDVNLAATSDAIIVGFNVRPDPTARRAAERENVDVRLYTIIYEAIDEIKSAMQGLLEPEYEEEVLGRAEVRATFKVPNVGTVAGCYVTDGKILRTAKARVLRDNVVVFEGELASLKRFKDDVKEVTQGYECGIGIERFNDIKEGDVIEAYHMKEVERQL